MDLFNLVKLSFRLIKRVIMIEAILYRSIQISFSMIWKREIVKDRVIKTSSKASTLHRIDRLKGLEDQEDLEVWDLEIQEGPRIIKQCLFRLKMHIQQGRDDRGRSTCQNISITRWPIQCRCIIGTQRWRRSRLLHS